MCGAAAGRVIGAGEFYDKLAAIGAGWDTGEVDKGVDVIAGIGVEVGVEVLILGVRVCGEHLNDFLVGSGELGGAGAGREVGGGRGCGDKSCESRGCEED